MTNYKSVNEYCNDLKLDYPKLTDFEVLTIATQIQRNDILKAALVVGSTDSDPTALEAIAIQLGMGARGSSSIPDALHAIEDKLNEIKTRIEEIA